MKPSRDEIERALKGEGRPEMPPGLLDRLRDEIPTELRGSAGERSRFRLLPVAALVVTLIGAGIVSWRVIEENPPVPMEAPVAVDAAARSNEAVSPAATEREDSAEVVAIESEPDRTQEVGAVGGAADSQQTTLDAVTDRRSQARTARELAAPEPQSAFEEEAGGESKVRSRTADEMRSAATAAAPPPPQPAPVIPPAREESGRIAAPGQRPVALERPEVAPAGRSRAEGGVESRSAVERAIQSLRRGAMPHELDSQALADELLRNVLPEPRSEFQAFTLPELAVRKDRQLAVLVVKATELSNKDSDTTDAPANELEEAISVAVAAGVSSVVLENESGRESEFTELGETHSKRGDSFEVRFGPETKAKIVDVRFESRPQAMRSAVADRRTAQLAAKSEGERIALDPAPSWSEAERPARIGAVVREVVALLAGGGSRDEASLEILLARASDVAAEADDPSADDLLELVRLAVEQVR
ncbi:MAG: hypothetical protein KY459_06905 [Acidobacteria bacterium]|nr:hypothetical protein [Acidobacteriota bacterium]